MKTLKYVKKHEPKFFGKNYSKVYTKDKAYNESIRKHLIKVFGKVCCYCGIKLYVKELTLDHVMPREKVVLTELQTYYFPAGDAIQ